MASILMHMGIALELVKNGYIEEAQTHQLILGTLLPDYTIAQNHHFKSTDRGREVFCLSDFRRKYAQSLACDVMYTGYYLHLLEDNIFRDTVYNKYGWDPAPAGNIQKLYGDYSALNSYLISRYSLTKELVNAATALDRDIGFTINYEELTSEIELYFSTPPMPEHKPFFFSREMADEFLEKAYGCCVKEISAIKNGYGYIDESIFSWEKR